MKFIFEKRGLLLAIVSMAFLTMVVMAAGISIEGHLDFFVIAVAFLSGALFFLVVYGINIYRQAKAREYTAVLISDVLQGDKTAEVQLEDPGLPTCWRERECYFLQCPVYGRDHIRCWLVDGTFCRGEASGDFPDKLDYCFGCEVFKTAVEDDPVREMEERFYGLMYLLGDREKKVSDMYKESEKQRQMLEFLLNLSRGALSSLELEALLDLAVTQVTGQIADFAAFFIVDHDGKLQLFAQEGFQEGLQPKVVDEDGADFVEAVMAGEELLVCRALADEPWLADQFTVRKIPTLMIGVPLISREEKFGMLLAGVFRDRQYSEFDRKVFQVAADQIAMAVSNASKYASVNLRAATDGLTGLANHRSLFEVIDKELARSQRYGHPLSLIMVDIDHFKHFNDAYGHPQGDKVLIEVAKLIKDSVRTADTAARYGGEEFAVLLPETPFGAHNSVAGSAMQVAERMRLAVEEHLFEGRPGRRDVRITISLGVAEHPSHAGLLSELVAAADTALYQAKEKGRNRVELADERQKQQRISAVDE